MILRGSVHYRRTMSGRVYTRRGWVRVSFTDWDDAEWFMKFRDKELKYMVEVEE